MKDISELPVCLNCEHCVTRYDSDGRDYLFCWYSGERSEPGDSCTLFTKNENNTKGSKQ